MDLRTCEPVILPSLEEISPLSRATAESQLLGKTLTKTRCVSAFNAGSHAAWFGA
jgi:hypothetical protein